MEIKPAVSRRLLFLISASIWGLAGLIMIERAYDWLSDFDSYYLILVLALSAILGAIFYFTGFVRIVRKNINRINSLPENVCLFAFTAWKGYIIIALMITGGILLRYSSFPKHYLAVLYIAMSGSLLLGSGMFFNKYFKYKIKNK